MSNKTGKKSVALTPGWGNTSGNGFQSEIENAEIDVLNITNFILNSYVQNSSVFLFTLLGSYFLTPRIESYLPGTNVPLKFAFLAGTYAVFSNFLGFLMQKLFC
jgi:hypothetical protein